MKTTKKDFIENLTNSKTVFLGIARKEMKKDEIECCITPYLKGDAFWNTRTVKKASNTKIVFCDDCVLYLDEHGEKTFDVFDFNGKKVLRYTRTTKDENNMDVVKSLYYAIA